MTAIDLNGFELPSSGLEFRLHLAWLHVETRPRGGEGNSYLRAMFFSIYFSNHSKQLK